MSKTDGLPDVDLGPVLDDLKQQDKDQQQQQQPQDTATQDQQQPAIEHPDRNEFGQFKSKDELLTGYKELQGFSTRTSQENKSLKDKNTELERELELMRSGQSNYQPPGQQQTNFDETFVENPQAAIAEQVRLQRIAEILEEEQVENPQEFQERYAYVQMLGQKYPHLTKSPTGVKKLFGEADKFRTEQAKTNAHKSFNLLFGVEPTEENIQKFKQAMGITETQQTQQQTNIGDAYMPDSTSSTRTGADTDQKPNRDQAIKQAVDDGDADAVLDNLFAEIREE
jgi:hypothetical protein